MKKLVGIVAGVCLVAGLSAQAQGPVYSKNVVGFQKIDLAPGLNMIGNNWKAVGGADEIPIQDLLDTTELVGGDDFFTSDLLYAWDQSMNAGLGGYRFYYFGDWAGAYGAEYDRKWYVSGEDEPTEDVIARGQGFWVRHIGAGAKTAVAGEVPNDASKSFTFPLGLSQFSSAYTANLQLNGSNLNWSAKGGDDFFNSDVIYVWDPSLNAGVGGYSFYYFGDWDGAYGAEYDNKWYVPGEDDPTEDAIKMGAGAWFRAYGPSDSSLIESKPYTL